MGQCATVLPIDRGRQVILKHSDPSKTFNAKKSPVFNWDLWSLMNQKLIPTDQ